MGNFSTYDLANSLFLNHIAFFCLRIDYIKASAADNNETATTSWQNPEFPDNPNKSEEQVTFWKFQKLIKFVRKN